MLGIGLTLFVLREMNHKNEWNDKVIKISFWSINIGLLLMVLISVLPIGLAQTWASVKYGLWYARSADFLQLPVMVTLRWMRVIGDTIFAAGVVALIYFVIGLKTGWSYKKD
jgi:nitric oxide reductase subunit B